MVKSGEKGVRGIVVKKTCLVLALTGAMGLASTQTMAGFVADFLDESAAMSNVTQAGVVEASSLNVVTGGGFVYRTPRKDFVPLSVAAPTLKAGCGGIDLFLGAFSIPSREEFVSFLRSVGTALPGLAFQLALQTMAPDLNEMVGRYADLIRSYTNRYSDSCTAAQALLEQTGAAEHLQRAVQSATNKLRSDGTASDQSEADRRVRDDGAAAIDNAAVRRDSAGNIVDAPQINLTWALLKATKGTVAGLQDKHMQELMMTLVGTTVFTRTGEGENTVIQANTWAGVDLLPALFGEVRGQTGLMLLTCPDKAQCLNPVMQESAEVSLTDRIRTAADSYRAALATRNPDRVSDEELLLLSGISGVPLMRILNLAAVSRYRGIADDLVNTYIEAAAYEALVHAVEELAGTVRSALAASGAGALSAEHLEHVRRLQTRLVQVERRLYERNDRVMQAMMRATALVQQLEHIERSLTGNQAATLVQTLSAQEGGRP